MKRMKLMQCGIHPMGPNAINLPFGHGIYMYIPPISRNVGDCLLSALPSGNQTCQWNIENPIYIYICVYIYR